MKRFLLAAAIILVSFPAQARHHRHHHRSLDANGNYATVHTKSGLTARVTPAARDKFQAFINDVEATGYTIRDIGCLSSGHMRNSKHHWGGACDFDQERRNVTAKAMYHVTEIAHRHGLIDGCEWSNRDCGHIEVPTHDYASRSYPRSSQVASRSNRTQFSAKRKRGPRPLMEAFAPPQDRLTASY